MLHWATGHAPPSDLTRLEEMGSTSSERSGIDHAALGVAMRGVLVFSGNHGGGGGLGDSQRLLRATGLSHERHAPV